VSRCGIGRDEACPIIAWRRGGVHGDRDLERVGSLSSEKLRATGLCLDPEEFITRDLVEMAKGAVGDREDDVAAANRPVVLPGLL
jgi:hypothetical protein